MTVTTNPNENDLVPVSRIFLKQSGLVVRIIRSASGSEYKVVWMDNRVVGCEQVSGEPCLGWKFHRSCHHATLTEQLERERNEHRSHTEQKPLETSQKGALSSASGKAFSLFR